jgi:hypothetical protein
LIKINVSAANAKIPRKVQCDWSGIQYLCFLLILAVLIPVWGAYNDTRNSYLHNILRREGNETNGIVAESYSTRRSGVYVRYRFSVNAVPYSGHANMTAVHYKIPAPGTQIPIRYLPNDPRVNQPSNWEWDWGHIVYFLFGLVILGGAGNVIIEALRERKLARMGVIVEGKVTGCAPGQKLFTVYYEFTTKENVWMEGSTDMPEEREAGTSIPVIYLRSNPKRNDVYPIQGFSDDATGIYEEG